jgi:hypothetical protein
MDMCLGHEGAGVVEKLGPDVKDLKMWASLRLILYPKLLPERPTLTILQWR